MTLCLAQSLIDQEGKLDARDQAQKYVDWIHHGYMSSKAGHAFDIGNGKSEIYFTCLCDVVRIRVIEKACNLTSESRHQPLEWHSLSGERSCAGMEAQQRKRSGTSTNPWTRPLGAGTEV